MGFTSVLAQAQKLIESRLHPGDIAVDATVGTGVDTAFLAEKVGAKGRVYGFDIQRQALTQAKTKLAKLELVDRVILLKHDHAEMTQHLPHEAKGKISAVMFNLGYLPGSDRKVITTKSSTIPALESAIEWIKPDGVVTIVAYPGHEGGGEEAEYVRQWGTKLPADRFQVLCYDFINQPIHRPFLLAVTKKKHRTNIQTER